MRIIYITGEPDGYTLGGVGRYYLETYPRLLRQHRVDVIACLSYVLDEIETPQDQPIQIRQENPLIALVNTKLVSTEESIDRTQGTSTKGIIESIAHLLDDSYDIIFANDFYSFPIVRQLLIKYRDAKLVYFNHLPFEVGFSYFTNPQLNQLLLERAMIYLADATISPSVAVQRQLQSYSNREIQNNELVRHGITMQPRHERRISTPVNLISILRFTNQKMPIYMIDIARICIERGIPIKWRVIGRGEQKAAFEKLAERMGISEAFEHYVYVGSGDTYFNLLKQSDLFVTTTIYETFGLAITEALSCSLPVLAFRQYAVDELISDGFNGYLFDIGDFENFVDRIEMLARSEHTYERLCKNAHASVSNLNIDNHMEELERVFRKVSDE